MTEFQTAVAWSGHVEAFVPVRVLDEFGEHREQSGMMSRRVTLRLDEGLHVRPCSLIAKVAATAESPVHLGVNGQTADASSMFDLMALGAEKGSEIEITGDVASQAVIEQIVALFDSDFAD